MIGRLVRQVSDGHYYNILSVFRTCGFTRTRLCHIAKLDKTTRTGQGWRLPIETSLFKEMKVIELDVSLCIVKIMLHS